jgi:hypothetical protein
MTNDRKVPQSRQVHEEERLPNLTDDEVYRALAKARRRRLLYVLFVEEESTVSEMATVLAGWGAVDTGTMTTPRERDRIIRHLKHADLPVLDEAELISYDRERDTVSLEPIDESVIGLVCQSIEAEPAGPS